jgi:hypothetical protein
VDTDVPTTMVALSNPRTEHSLVALAAALAKHDDGRLLATHVIQVPDQTSLAAAADRRERISETSEKLLADARADAEESGSPSRRERFSRIRALARCSMRLALTMLTGSSWVIRERVSREAVPKGHSTS